MGFSQKARKLRDRVRKQYTVETGLSDWKAPEFQRWLVERGELPPAVTVNSYSKQPRPNARGGEAEQNSG